jgi:general secretion pathway protein G
MKVNRHKGFTLVELVVVVMILGILAAIAVPKLLDTTKGATDGGLKQTLGIIRDAIELYAADNPGSLPGADGAEATFRADLQPYFRTGMPFPSCPVGAKNNEVRITTTGALLVGEASPTKGWAYDNVSGQFIINYTGVSSDGTTTYDDF